MSDSFQRSNLAQSMEAQHAELEHALTRSPFRLHADRIVQQGAKTINILRFKDIRALNDNYRDEFPFGAVDRASQLQAQIYHTIARPFVRAAVTTFTAQACRHDV
ncbi:hypothetical protein [Bradyrhizobium sp. CCBAU 11357]|uniref:hypothetical protein n=1 Tax=Bradyrhizobium sp. CCBAU 11357 TaxID=1630808 RepID=UPI00230389D6|nr:hypothetical protein [Bradyrhizobium sp. CCBAU 11357]MDA9498162.1 hypothetical protein [Bradyrhizobium sp. CCBAU 11357]